MRLIIKILINFMKSERIILVLCFKIISKVCQFNLINIVLLRGLPTLFPWPSKKCYEALQQKMHGYVPIISYRSSYPILFQAGGSFGPGPLHKNRSDIAAAPD